MIIKLKEVLTPRFPFRAVLMLLLILSLSTVSAAAENRIGINTEIYSSFFSLNGLDGDWNYLLSGQSGLSFKNKSRDVRGEVSLELTEALISSLAGEAIVLPTLKKLYIRSSFRDVQLSMGKTRASWGAGFVFNAGDIIFGSDSISFDAAAVDPRAETSWLTAVEIPLGDFSFAEIIALPGDGALSDASAGGRISIEAGVFNIQAGYLYRNQLFAGLGEEGQRAFFCLEGIAPFNWHLSASASTFLDRWDAEKVKESSLISGGAFYDHLIGEYGDVNLSWRLEFLLRPLGEWAVVTDMSDAEESEYGLYLYPALSLTPPGRLSYSLSSIVSPVDVSAFTTLAVSWNIFEELILLGFTSVQTSDLQVDGVSAVIGLRYSY